MSEKPKRRFWQFHLSTAIILMLAAGGFIFLDVKFWTEAEATLSLAPLLVTEVAMLVLLALAVELPRSQAENETPKKREFWQLSLSTVVILMLLIGMNVGTVIWFSNSSWQMVGRIFIAAPYDGVLILIAFASEFLIRRREGRKP